MVSISIMKSSLNEKFIFSIHFCDAIIIKKKFEKFIFPIRSYLKNLQNLIWQFWGKIAKINSAKIFFAKSFFLKLSKTFAKYIEQNNCSPAFSFSGDLEDV